MDPYDFHSESDNSEFGGFNIEDVVNAQNVVQNQNDLSDASSVSSEFSSSGSSSDDEDFDPPNLDVRENPPEWKSENFTAFQTPISNIRDGPTLPQPWNLSSEPLDYFRLFLTPDIVSKITRYTNEYARISIGKKRIRTRGYVDKGWNLDGSDNVTETEILAYFGCCIILSINPCKQLRHVFSKDPFMCNQGIKAVFTLKRFQKIGQYLCMCDKQLEPDRESPNYDKGYKVRMILDALNECFPAYYQHSEYVCVDESTESCKSRLDFLQYNPMKPIKRGLKLFCLCDSKKSETCYLLRFEPYFGKRYTKVSENGLYYDVVMRLAELVKGKNVKLFCDNLYSSIFLFRKLKLDYQVYSTGTARSNRVGLPPAVKNPPKMIRGEHKMFQDANDKYLCSLVWQDTKAVKYISVAYSPTVVGVALRRVSHRYERVSQPLIATMYNSFYQSVDRFDQLKQKYLVNRRSYRSWKYLWYFCFQSMIVNSYILYKKTHPDIPKSFSHIDFRLKLAKGLIGNFSCRKNRNVTVQPLFVGPEAPMDEQMASHDNVRMDGGRLRMCKAHKQFHGSTKRTVYGCKLCGIYICKDCTVRWHKP